MSGCYPITTENLCKHRVTLGTEECQLCTLENAVNELYASLNNRIEGLHANKLQQIDLNKRAEKKFEELENKIDCEIEIRKDFIELIGVRIVRVEDFQDVDFNKLRKRIDKIEDLQNGMLHTPNLVWTKYCKAPFKCPVCDGSGKVQHPIYGLLMCECDACQSKGIVWG